MAHSADDCATVTPSIQRQTSSGATDGSDAGRRGDFLSQGRSPGFVAKLYYAPERDVIVVSVANSYAVPADWARAVQRLALVNRYRFQSSVGYHPITVGRWFPAHGAFAPLVDPLAYELIELQRRDFPAVVAEELEV